MIRLFSLAILALALSACRTQQVAMDQANHGVSLIAGLQKSLDEFRHVETHSLQSRRAAIDAQLDSQALVDKTHKRDARSRIAVGDSRSERAVALLLASADALAEEDAAYQRTLAENDRAMAALLTPLPATKETTAAAQTALAELGEELDGATRRDELLQFASKLKQSVDAAKEKIAEAQVEASTSALSKTKDN